jgi:glutathione S-transferase
MLEELGVPLRGKRYEREPSLQAPAALRAVHPLGKSPVITDGTTTLAESGAILEYLAEAYGHGRLKPGCRNGRARSLHLFPALCRRLADAASVHEAGVQPHPLAPAVLHEAGRPRHLGGANKQLLDPQIGNHFMFLEMELGKREWFAGPEFTAADIQMSFPLEAAAARAPLVKQMPKISAWLDRIHARPAYRRALDKGGPYELMS